MLSRSTEAADRKRSGKYNCSQAVAATYADIIALDEPTVLAATSAFGTSMGTTEATCGALIGAGFVIGTKINDRTRSRAAMKHIFEKFKEANGATICRDLKGIATGCPLRDCNGCVADAARFLEEELETL